MSETPQDTGLATVLLERLEKQRLPLALEMKDKVDRAERLVELFSQLVDED